MPHVSLLPHEPNPDGSCRACRSPVHQETLLCVRCGAAYGEKNRCPHCHTVCRTLPHPTLYHRCSVCGKPRLPAAPSLAPTAPVVRNALQRAGSENRNATFLRMLTYGLTGVGGFSALFVLLFLWVANFGTTGNLTFSGLALVPLLLSLFTYFSSKKALRERDQALETAYGEQIVALLTSTGETSDAPRIAAQLGINVERTEALLSKLNADDRMTSDITDDGEVVYRVAPADRYRILAEPPQRIDTSSAPSTLAEAAESDAMIDAELDDVPPAASKRTRTP